MFSLPHFSICNIAIDILHCVSLGVAQHIAGNVLHLLCWSKMRGRPVDNIVALCAIVLQR